MLDMETTFLKLYGSDVYTTAMGAFGDVNGVWVYDDLDVLNEDWKTSCRDIEDVLSEFEGCVSLVVGSGQILIKKDWR